MVHKCTGFYIEYLWQRKAFMLQNGGKSSKSSVLLDYCANCKTAKHIEYA
jgi:hypothetical protein